MKYPAYKIVTQNLVIRCYNPDDAFKLKDTVDANVEYLKPWMPWIKFEPTTIEQKIELLRSFRSEFDSGKDYTYGIFDLTENILIGGTGLHTRIGDNGFEIGYWIDSNHAGKGYATEVSSALCRIAFNVNNIDRVEIKHADTNIKSRRIPEKLGFIFEGTRKRLDFSFDNEVRNTSIWTLHKSDFRINKYNENIKAFDAVNNQIKLNM